MQHLVDRHEIGEPVLDRRRIGVAEAHRRLGLQNSSSDARAIASIWREVSKPSARRTRSANNWIMRPCADADIDHQIERALPRGGQHGAVDVGFRQMQRAHALPIGGVAFEIGRRGFIARGADFVEPLGVAHQHRIGRDRASAKRGFGEVALGRLRARQPIEHPSALRARAPPVPPRSAASDAG